MLGYALVKLHLQGREEMDELGVEFIIRNLAQIPREAGLFVLRLDLPERV